MTSPNLTDWGMYGLADIWNMVSQDKFDNFSHVRAWKKMQELCQGMADALTRAADDILARWPPDKSPAAAAFSERIQLLAATFREAADASGANGPTLSAVNIG